MEFDLVGYIRRIITNVEAKGIRPCCYHVYTHSDGKNNTLHLSYRLAENTTLEFNYNTKSQEGCILLNVVSELLDGCLAKELSVLCADFSNKEEPLSCDDLITQREVLQFVKQQWKFLSTSGSADK